VNKYLERFFTSENYEKIESDAQDAPKRTYLNSTQKGACQSVYRQDKMLLLYELLPYPEQNYAL